MLGPVHVTFSLAGALFALSLFEAAAANDAIPSTVSPDYASAGRFLHVRRADARRRSVLGIGVEQLVMQRVRG